MDRDLGELQDYEILNVVDNHREINRGGYGRVIEVSVNGAICAAKEMDPLIGIGPNNINRERFIKECILMSKLRHPNVVQFLGVHKPVQEAPPQPMSLEIDFEPQQEQLPWLIMEYLPFDLHSFLLRPVVIPLSVKVSVLFDVSKGLTFLHNNPLCKEIIHRDLSARNVLINSSLVAKIADFGLSRAVQTFDSTLSVNPGNPLYMPPECATGTNVHYDSKMDIFSFGIIILFTICQKFPQNLLQHNYTENGRLVARTEVQRRATYFDSIDQSDPIVISLNKLCQHCLEFEPKSRPTAEVLLAALQELSGCTPDDLLAMDKLELMLNVRELQVRCEEERRMKELKTQQLEQQTNEIERLRTDRAPEQDMEVLEQVSSLEGERTQLQAQLISVQDQLTSEMNHHHVETSQKQEEISRLQQTLEEKLQLLQRFEDALRVEKERNSDLQRIIELTEATITENSNHDNHDQLQGLHTELVQLRMANRHQQEDKHREIEQLQIAYSAQLQERERECQQLKETVRKREDDYQKVKRYAMNFKEQLDRKSELSLPPLPSSGLRVSISLHHTDVKPPLFGMHSGHCVLFNNRVLFGGGKAADSNEKKTIISYDLDTQKWSKLPVHPCIEFAMAVVKGKLLTIGGFDEHRNEYSDVIYEYNESGKKWDPLYQLPSKRSGASAIVYRNWLIVAGGFTTTTRALNLVDAMDCETYRWTSLRSLPEPAHQFQSTSYISLHRMNAQQDVAVWYLTSTQSTLKNPQQPTFVASIRELIYKGAPWTKLPDPPMKYSGVATLRGQLLAVGGKDTKHGQSSSKVHMYLHGTREWLKVAELTAGGRDAPRQKATCMVLSESKFLVLGGEERGGYVARVDSYNMTNT